MRAIAPALTILGLTILVVTPLGCEDNTTCTIGDYLCTDAEGESAAFDGVELRQCSDDEALGGDEDGEFVVIEDCGKQDQLCFIDIVAETQGCE